jgi:hypothetical protein
MEKSTQPWKLFLRKNKFSLTFIMRIIQKFINNHSIKDATQCAKAVKWKKAEEPVNDPRLSLPVIFF